ncbi:MAG: hypothetical protein IJT80_05540 [Lachnospiraceae bacterium]|nr:hypothetical protein [Lachnospiraceae bacterium]
MEKLTITLADGTKLKNIRTNGTNYVSDTRLTEADFEGKLQTVTISDGESERVLHNCKLVQITKVDKEYWFVLYEMTGDEYRQLKMMADIEYIAAMSDIEL